MQTTTRSQRERTVLLPLQAEYRRTTARSSRRDDLVFGAVESAVVTGAGRGIGREIAQRLVGRGYGVLATDLNLEAARETAELLGDRVWPMALDVRDAEAHRAAAAAAVEHGPIRVWVNNAGILRTDKAWSHTDEETRLMVEANLLGVIWGSRTAVEAMRAGGGHIINMASMSSFGPVPGLAVYGATKHAVLGFSGSLQGDLEQAGIPIRVHAVCPDAVDTGMVRERQAEPDSAIIFSTPKLLQPAEVAERAVSLLDGNKIVLAIPRNRAWLARIMAAFPRADLRLLELFRRIGEKKRQKVV
jgi:NAD(P)-dependent dehydrogenase (short-subunit alcohol dehydrogenase family)